MTPALKPMQRAVLRAGLASTGHAFHRTRGGYLPVTGERTVFTIRTIRAMAIDEFIAYGDQFAETVMLTPAGVAAAKALRDEEISKAAAA